MKLRDYQEEAIHQLFSAWRSGSKKVLLSLPTGAGKTNIAAWLMRRLEREGRKSLFISHRLELSEQAHTRLAYFGVNAGLVIPGHSPNGHKAIVGSIQSLVRRQSLDVDLVIVDECHRVLAPTFLKVLESHVSKGKPVLGLSATPFRLDGAPLGRVFDSLVTPITICELIEKKFLVPLRYFAAAEEGLTSGVKKIAGDYSSNIMFERMNKKILYDNVVEKYKQFCNGKALVFCCNVQHSIETAKTFNTAGVRAAHLDGETSLPERIKIVKDFRQGKVDVLSNVGLFTEGFDLSDISGVVLNRSTASKGLFVQMCGRAMRPAPGKTHGIIIDHGNNIKSHGFLEDIENHDIFSEPRQGDGIAPMKDCPHCGAMVYAGMRVCKYCKFIFPIGELEYKEAEFVEVKRPPVPPHLRKKWSQMTEAELKEYAEFRGFKPGWVRVQLSLQRFRRK